MAPVVVAFSGYGRSGKDSCAQHLVNLHGFERIAFADALKDVLYALNPVVLVGSGRRVRAVVDAGGWEGAKEITEIRELLQRLGTEAGRKILGDNIWIDTAFRRATSDRIAVSDCRFPNEAEAVKAMGGYVFRVERPGITAVNAHVSERALDDFKSFDGVINNDGTLGELGKEIDNALDKLGVL